MVNHGRNNASKYNYFSEGKSLVKCNVYIIILLGSRFTMHNLVQITIRYIRKIYNIIVITVKK